MILTYFLDTLFWATKNTSHPLDTALLDNLNVMYPCTIKSGVSGAIIRTTVQNFGYLHPLIPLSLPDSLVEDPRMFFNP